MYRRFVRHLVRLRGSVSCHMSSSSGEALTDSPVCILIPPKFSFLRLSAFESTSEFSSRSIFMNPCEQFVCSGAALFFMHRIESVWNTAFYEPFAFCERAEAWFRMKH